MKKIFKTRSKQGITLVESAIAVVLLGFAAAGILTLLISSGTKIHKISAESSAYAEATQKLDFIISAVSNGNNTTKADGKLDISALITATGGSNSSLYGISESNIVQTVSTYPDFQPGSGMDINDYIRGWYLELTYEGAVVSGFVSNSKGDFDS